MHVLETSGATRQVGHRLLGDVGAVVVQHDADNGLARVVRMQAFEQCDELATAMARLDVGDDLAAVQVQRCNDRQGAVAHVFVITPHAGVYAGHRRQIGGCHAECLHARLLIDADGIDRRGTRVVDRIGAVQVHVAIDHQHFGHLALELRVAPLKVVAHAVWLEFVGVEDAPDRGLARPSQSREARAVCVRADVRGQRRQRPQLCGVAQVLGLATSQVHDPRTSVIGDLRWVRPVVAILQPRRHTRRQGLVDAFVDRRAGCTQCALYLRGRLPIGVRQQHPGSFDFARRRRARARKFVEHCLVLPAQHQRRSPRPSCHASLQKESLGWHDRT